MPVPFPFFLFAGAWSARQAAVFLTRSHATVIQSVTLTRSVVLGSLVKTAAEPTYPTLANDRLRTYCFEPEWGIGTARCCPFP
jgi:hypothetical protein